MEIARRLKDDYKKLNEYLNGAKLADEVLSICGEGNADEDLLLQLRG